MRLIGQPSAPVYVREPRTSRIAWAGMSTAASSAPASGSCAAKSGSASRVLSGLKRVWLDSVEVGLESNIWHLRLMGLRHRPAETLFSLGRAALLFTFLELSCSLVQAGRSVQ